MRQAKRSQHELKTVVSSNKKSDLRVAFLMDQIKGTQLLCTFLCTTSIQQITRNLLKINGGDDETRTRDLCRDRAAF